MLLPDGFVFNIYKMSSWSRGIVVPLSIIWASRPVCPVPERAAIPELHVQGRSAATRVRSRREGAWRSFFTRVDLTLKRLEAKDPGLKNLLKKAYGYAVFPSVEKAAVVIGGAYGRGRRISLTHTRALVDAIMSGALSGVFLIAPRPTVVERITALAERMQRVVEHVAKPPSNGSDD